MKTIKKVNIIGIGNVEEVKTVNGGKVLVFEDGGRTSMGDEVDYIHGTSNNVQAYMMAKVIPTQLETLAEELDPDDDGYDADYAGEIADMVKELVNGYDQAEAISKIYAKETAEEAVADFNAQFPEWAGALKYAAPGSHPGGNAYWMQVV